MMKTLCPIPLTLASAGAEEKERFAAAVRGGSLGLGALYANELTGLCTPEELDRLNELARRLGRETGVAVRSAMITDIPGAAWTVVPALARSGVRYFSSAPNYMPFLPDRGDRVGGALRNWADRPFWWASPSGTERVLFWMAGRGYSWFHGMNAGQFGPESRRPILDYVKELAESGYPYDLVQVHYTIGGDNGPTDPDFPDRVRRWNDEFASPRIVIATVDRLRVGKRTSQRFSMAEHQGSALFPRPASRRGGAVLPAGRSPCPDPGYRMWRWAVCWPDL